jgi:hypothetical protein
MAGSGAAVGRGSGSVPAASRLRGLCCVDWDFVCVCVCVCGDELVSKWMLGCVDLGGSLVRVGGRIIVEFWCRHFVQREAFLNGFCCFGVFGCFVREFAPLLLHVVNYPVFVHGKLDL